MLRPNCPPPTQAPLGVRAACLFQPLQCQVRSTMSTSAATSSAVLCADSFGAELLQAVFVIVYRCTRWRRHGHRLAMAHGGPTSGFIFVTVEAWAPLCILATYPRPQSGHAQRRGRNSRPHLCQSSAAVTPGPWLGVAGATQFSAHPVLLWDCRRVLTSSQHALGSVAASLHLAPGCHARLAWCELDKKGSTRQPAHQTEHPSNTVQQLIHANCIIWRCFNHKQPLHSWLWAHRTLEGINNSHFAWWSGKVAGKQQLLPLRPPCMQV